MRRWVAGVATSIAVIGCGRRNFEATDAAALVDTADGAGPDAGPTAPVLGLIAYWPFDENTGTAAVDATGNGHLATLTNGASWGAGKVGAAVQLDGVAAYVAVAQTATFDRASAACTLSAWLLDDTVASSLGLNMWHRILAWHDSSGFDHTIGLGTGNVGDTRVMFGSLVTSSTETSSVSPGDLESGWHLVTFAFASGVGTLYVDGAASSTGALSNVVSPGFDTTTLYIGQKGDTTRYVNGRIDDVRIYDRALSAAEVMQLYLATGGT